METLPVLGTWLADLRRRESDAYANVSALEKTRERAMSDSVYKVIEIIGTSKDSWESAAKIAVERASKTLRDLRVAEVVSQGPRDRGWQSRSLPDEAECVLQVYGLKSVCWIPSNKGPRTAKLNEDRSWIATFSR